MKPEQLKAIQKEAEKAEKRYINQQVFIEGATFGVSLKQDVIKKGSTQAVTKMEEKPYNFLLALDFPQVFPYEDEDDYEDSPEYAYIKFPEAVSAMEQYATSLSIVSFISVATKNKSYEEILNKYGKIVDGSESIYYYPDSEILKAMAEVAAMMDREIERITDAYHLALTTPERLFAGQISDRDARLNKWAIDWNSLNENHAKQLVAKDARIKELEGENERLRSFRVGNQSGGMTLEQMKLDKNRTDK